MSHAIDRIAVRFDDDAVADAGLLLAGTLARRLGLDLLEVDRTHRAHAVVELAIRDLKHDAGMIHMPSGIFQANAAWAIACTLAHNLVRSGRRWTLRLPARWPWRTAWQQALADLRALPQPC